MTYAAQMLDDIIKERDAALASLAAVTAERDALRRQQEKTHALAKRLHAAVVALREESRRLFPTKEQTHAE